jgi:hypothetical protein
MVRTATQTHSREIHCLPKAPREAFVNKYKPYSRREFRHRFASWARHNAWLIAGLTAGLMVLLAVETILLVGVGTPGPVSWWLLGAVQAGMIALYLHVLHNAILRWRGSEGASATLRRRSPWETTVVPRRSRAVSATGR